MTDHMRDAAQRPTDGFLRGVREALIEKCAKIADEEAALWPTHIGSSARVAASKIRALASQPPAAACNAAGVRYASPEQASWAINGAHDFAEGLRTAQPPAAPVETAWERCSECPTPKFCQRHKVSGCQGSPPPQCSAATEAVVWQFRAKMAAAWSDWINCQKWEFEKVASGLKTGWRQPDEIEIRALGVIHDQPQGARK